MRCAAQSDSVLDQCVEHGLKLERGSTDDLQDFSGGRLLVQCLSDLAVAFLKLGIPLLQLLEEPGILDRDDCLVSERLQQRDLTVAVRFGRLATNADAADAPR